MKRQFLSLLYVLFIAAIFAGRTAQARTDSSCPQTVIGQSISDEQLEKMDLDYMTQMLDAYAATPFLNKKAWHRYFGSPHLDKKELDAAQAVFRELQTFSEIPQLLNEIRRNAAKVAMTFSAGDFQTVMNERSNWLLRNFTKIGVYGREARDEDMFLLVFFLLDPQQARAHSGPGTGDQRRTEVD